MAVLAGCASSSRATPTAAIAPAPPEFRSEAASQEALQPSQQLIQQVHLEIETRDLAGATSRADGIVASLGGRVDSSVSSERRVELELRVPAARSNDAIRDLSGLGEVKNERVELQDVGAELVDLDARLQTWIALRDRLREHLSRAETVSDILAVERELARIQSDIDALQARLNYLRDEVAFSRIHLRLERELVLGPLGWVAVGLGRVIGALFVWD